MALLIEPVQFESWIGAGSDSAVTLTDADLDTILLLIEGASDAIAQITGRSFVAEAGATKEFYAEYPDRLVLPDVRTITALTYDSSGNNTFSTTLTAGTDFYLTPINPQPDAGIYTGVRIYPTSSRGFWGRYRVRVVGDWGYVVNGAAPAQIQTACLMLVARLWARKGAPLGMLQNTDLGTFARLASADPDVMAILNRYKAASTQWILV